MAKNTYPTYSYRINDYSNPSGWSTNSIFDKTFKEPEHSPINTFNSKLAELNILTVDPKGLKKYIDELQTQHEISSKAYTKVSIAIMDTNNVSPVIANLVLLGYISAVESYFRELVRRIISIDISARRACELRMIAFGAALYHSKEMLPEALLERISFITQDSIKEVLKDYVGIKNTPFPAGIESVLAEYEAVCQIRHCIVHRFGKLGANNAIKLGLDSHGAYIEKPIKLTYGTLQTVGIVCSNVVKEVNQFAWESVMMRMIGETTDGRNWRKKGTIPWTWVYKKDKKAFKAYFDTFALTTSSLHSVTLLGAYTDYKTKFQSLPS